MNLPAAPAPRVAAIAATLATAALSDPASLPAQELLVSGFTSNEVHRYDYVTGDYLGPLDTIVNPQGIVHGPGGEIFVAAEGSDRVLRYDPDTLALIDEFVADDPATPEDETGGLNGPTGLAFGEDGNLYVASFDNDRILRYDGQTGAFLDVFVDPGSGGLDGPDAGIVFGPDGALYVPSYWNDSVKRYDAGTGAYLDDYVPALLGGLRNPRTLAFRSDGTLFVSSEGSNQILRYAWGGAFLDEFAGHRDPTGFFLSPYDGDVYATSVDRDYVRRYDGDTGVRLSTPVGSGSGGLVDAVFLAYRPYFELRTRRIDPGITGQSNTVSIEGLAPGTRVILLLGSVAASVKLSRCPHAYLGIGDPQIVPLVADGAGVASITAPVDPIFAGRTTLLQAFDPDTCRISNLVVQTFE
jgi:hypothetical protein